MDTDPKSIDRGEAGPSVAAAGLTGRRVLVVEDEMLIALDTADALAAGGAVVVGPCARVPKALALLQSTPIDAAVLDINVAGTMVWPVAMLLKQLAIPFVFLSGFCDTLAFPAEVAAAPRLSKPVPHSVLIEALTGALTGSAEQT